MKVTVFCSNKDHPILPNLIKWVSRMSGQSFQLNLETDLRNLVDGDLLFLVSCNQILGKEVTSKFHKVLVLHASDLPEGRGWSPYIWDILNGANKIVVTLLEASYPVDTGAIWLKKTIDLNGYELLPEIHNKLFAVELDLIEEAIISFKKIHPMPQLGMPSTPYRRRTPTDSKVDPNKTIAEQFNLLRVCDPERFPAFFDYLGHRYFLRIEREK